MIVFADPCESVLNCDVHLYRCYHYSATIGSGRKISLSTLIQLIKRAQQLGVKGCLLKIRQRFRRITGSLKGMPDQLHIEISNICDLDCEYCSLKAMIKPKITMNRETFGEVRPYFKWASSVALSGLAEPLLNRHLIEFIKVIKCESPECSVSLITNAMLLTERMGAELIEAGLDQLEFSIDGTDAGLVEEIRKGTDLEKLLNNIRKFAEQRNSAKKRPGFGAAMVLQKKNYHELPKVVEFVSEIGVDVLRVNNVEPYTEELEQSILWNDDIPNDLPSVIDMSIEMAKSKNIPVIMAGFSPVETPSCREVTKPLIMADGEVAPCAALAYERVRYFGIVGNRVMKNRVTLKKKTFGNVNDTPLNQIWMGKEYRRFRDNVLSGRFPVDCQDCMIKHSNICAQGDQSNDDIVRELWAQMKKAP